MPVPNVFNYSGTVNGDQTILTGVSGKSWRIRQLNVQNRSGSTISVSIKQGSEVIVGPIAIGANNLWTMELSSEEYQNYLSLNSGENLVVNTSASAAITVYGFGGNA